MLLVVFGACVILANYYYIFLYLTGNWKGSLIPFVGGVSCASGIYFCGIHTISKYWFIPLLIDYGSVPIIFHALIYVFCRIFKINFYL